ncbi:hypothetical protein [Flavobacterium paronense]|uniref:Lipocalin-like domain-containing protein n=2 Tax=Flavobacterium paronense TaxID=1392775 RepID=A0ABV5GDL5_9FLAO
MNTIKHFSFALVVALITTLSSCSSDSNSGGGTAALGTLKAKIGGTNFTSITQGTMAVDAFNGSYHNFSISGVDASGKSIILTILATEITAGTTYQFEESNATLFASCAYSEININNPTVSQSWGAPYDGGGNSGSITITSKTASNVQGTFSLTVGNPETVTTRSITNGSFNINITAGN